MEAPTTLDPNQRLAPEAFAERAQAVKPGSMGRALPGFTVTLVDPATGEPGEERRRHHSEHRPAAPLGPPAVYGQDRLFVYVRLAPGAARRISRCLIKS